MVVLRHFHISSVDINFFYYQFKIWNNYSKSTLNQCRRMGKDICTQIFYENLILNPEKELKELMEFLNEKWDDALLNHEKYIGDKIINIKAGWSSHQIVKPINKMNMTAWINKLYKIGYNQSKINTFMLKEFGYELDLDKINLQNKLDPNITKNFFFAMKKYS